MPTQQGLQAVYTYIGVTYNIHSFPPPQTLLQTDLIVNP